MNKMICLKYYDKIVCGDGTLFNMNRDGGGNFVLTFLTSNNNEYVVSVDKSPQVISDLLDMIAGRLVEHGEIVINAPN